MVQSLAKAKNYKSLKPSELRWRCNPDIFKFDSTETIEPIEGIIGQERALKALKMGVEINAPGYNVFVTGLSGTGKATTIQKILERLNPDSNTVLNDYAYVNNFKSPENPRLLIFPAGKATEFSKAMDNLIDFLIEKIPQVLEDEVFIQKKKEILDKFAAEEKQIMKNFERKIKAAGFVLGQIQMGQYYRPEVMPVVENHPVPIQQINELVNDNKISSQDMDEIITKYQDFTVELQEIYKRSLKINQEFQETTLKLEQDTVLTLIDAAISNLKENFPIEKVHNYLDEVKESILNSLNIFKEYGKPTTSELQEDQKEEDPFYVYSVNIILDNSNTKGCPVIIENFPTFNNLFGSIEKKYTGQQSILYSDFMNIKSGSFLKANGGYLVLNAFDALTEPGVWKTLKRALLYRKLEIQDNPNIYQVYVSSLKPETIDVNTKVILIGNYEIYNILSAYEEDFKKIFKVRADFDYEMENTEKALQELAKLTKKLCKEENLLDFDKTAVAELAEFSAHYTGKKNKLTTRFAVIADMVRESNYWANKEGAAIVNSNHVKTAYENYIYRHNQIDEKIENSILEGTLIIDTEGKKVGEINGLAIFGSEDHFFGKPSKITVNVSAGDSGIINIEREAKLSGRTYDKAVLIITGYFREKFGFNKTLSFSASICFEQSYSGIDGDSASSTEIYALLSALSGIPISQSIAVTGSVNQKGIIQPIGGVNEKIEGFFKICKKRGLNGSHGVIIPQKNVQDLMLDYEVIEAVEKKLFHIYAISTIEEGIEILTGVKAGKRDKNGNWEKNSVFYYVDKRLIELKESKSKTTKTKTSKTKKRK